MADSKAKRGNVRKGARQANLNAFKYKHNKNSKKTRKIFATPIEGLCSSCTRKLEWKKDYRKYKPLSQPKKCTSCSRRSIVNSYHVICRDCFQEQQCCAKCLQKREIVLDYNEATKEEEDQRQKAEILSQLRERDRRAYLRALERGDLDSSSEEETDDEESEDEAAPGGVSGRIDYAGGMLPEDSSEEEDSDDPLPVAAAVVVEDAPVLDVDADDGESYDSDSGSEDDPFFSALKTNEPAPVKKVDVPPSTTSTTVGSGEQIGRDGVAAALKGKTEKKKVYVSEELRSRSFVFGAT
eukprot:TRINITY_DN2134_c0_g1_i1.p1 TRINITY_DN2134_c0_g1~~TRINITY_DN2134_c0_g1_i1.p1  ORF type:complete len:296 (-),score=60.48 TRINITY_DN2134_c0_g1_i1:81-968(-)